MRSVRGWIRNLADGLGPSAGSVNVALKVGGEAGPGIDLTTDKLGALTVVHQGDGSGSAGLAGPTGRFGWDMELAPGKVWTSVIPHDPQEEHRWRFPDESAQYGKAFLSDLERLGWAGGRDQVIWNGVFGGDNPTAAQWTTDPTLSAFMGNGSIVQSSIGTTPGRVTIRKFIAMLGGVPFTVEQGDLQIPVAGDTAMETNPGPGDRWDLICAAIDWNPSPSNTTYGKQRFEFTKGTPGGGIPPVIPNNTDNWRRLPLHAVKMVAGAGVYSAATDVRRWANPPPGVNPGSIVRWYQTQTIQTFAAGGFIQTALNTTMASQELILPLGIAYDGYAQWNGLITGSFPLSATAQIRLALTTEGRVNAADAAIPGTQFILMGSPLVWPAIWKERSAGGEQNPFSVTFPLSRIPGYAADGLSSSNRTWARLRLVGYFTQTNGPGEFDINEQNIAIHLWPAS
jgi:hypothetical protein